MNKVFMSYSYRDNQINYIIKNLKDYFYDANVKFFSMETIYQYETIVFQSVTDIIDTCNVMVCFMDRDNSNIMFELGYALGKNKKIILIGDYKDIPYDMKQLTFIRRSNDISEILLSIEKNLDHTNNNNDSILNEYNDREIFDKAIKEPSFLDNIEPKEFEDIVYNWLRYNGLNVERPVQSRDMGCDFILYTATGRKVLIEVKKYRHTSKLSISVLRQLIGVMAIENIDAGIIINSGQYTDSILHYVDEIEQTVCLWSIENLVNISESIKELTQKLDYRL